MVVRCRPGQGSEIVRQTRPNQQIEELYSRNTMSPSSWIYRVSHWALAIMFCDDASEEDGREKEDRTRQRDLSDRTNH
jgi:hypothetical protein